MLTLPLPRQGGPSRSVEHSLRSPDSVDHARSTDRLGRRPSFGSCDSSSSHCNHCPLHKDQRQEQQRYNVVMHTYGQKISILQHKDASKLTLPMADGLLQSSPSEFRTVNLNAPSPSTQ